MQVPYNLSVGTDITHIPRIAAWLRAHASRKCFERLFTRLECPTLYSRCLLAQRRSKSVICHAAPTFSASAFWDTVDIAALAHPAERVQQDDLEERSPFGQLSQFVAGR